MSFRKERVFDCAGQKVEFSAFFKEFECYCESNGRKADPEFLVIQEIILRSDRFTIGVRNNKQYLLNVSFDPKAKAKKKAIEPNKDDRF
jgi:hypothetical protein